MNKRIGWIVVPLVFIVVGVLLYKFFNEGESIYTHSNQEFTMNVKDYASIDDEIYIKYLKAEDNRCKGEDCEREGEKIAKLIVIHNPYIDSVELSSINDDEIKINKTDYTIKIINYDTDSDEINLKLLKKEK